MLVGVLVRRINDGTLQTTYGVDPAGNRTSERVVDATARATVSNKTYIVSGHDQVESED